MYSDPNMYRLHSPSVLTLTATLSPSLRMLNSLMSGLSAHSSFSTGSSLFRFIVFILNRTPCCSVIDSRHTVRLDFNYDSDSLAFYCKDLVYLLMDSLDEIFIFHSRNTASPVSGMLAHGIHRLSGKHSPSHLLP